MSLLLLLLSCSDGDVDTAVDCGDPADTLSGVIHMIDFAERADGVSIGFDLDGRDSNTSDAEGCYQEDLEGPNGEEGIDNAFSSLIPVLEASEGAALDGLIQNAINSGELLLMYQIQRVDDPYDDECVDAELFRAEGTPMISSSDQIVSSQTFEAPPVDERSRFEGIVLEDGALEAGPFEFDLPLQILAADLQLTLHDAMMHVELNEDGSAQGYLSGGVDVESIITQLEPEAIDADLEEILFALLRSLADLNPDETGACQHLSVVLEFESTPAYIFPDAE